MQRRRSMRVRTKLRKVAEGRPRRRLRPSHKNIFCPDLDDEKGRKRSLRHRPWKKESGQVQDSLILLLPPSWQSARRRAKSRSNVVFDRGGYMFHAGEKKPCRRRP